MTDIINVLQSQIRSNDLKIDSDGKSIFSIRSVERLVGVNRELLLKHFKPSSLKTSKLAQKLIEQGFSPASLESWKTLGVPDEAVSLVIVYYAMDAGRYCTDEAKNMREAFTTLGLRVLAYV
ncbi:MAG: hypothetical protein V7L02_11630 [Nostoc sp.]|uniref:hypothetical protein n=1 Tax=Nostoc sp. TaxID=1180 RepID=UPI002FF57518